MAQADNQVPDVCDETCDGTLPSAVQEVKQKMIEVDTASDVAEVFKALGDPTRVRIIFALLQNELCVHDISKVLEMGQSAVSHQLRYLRNLRIVRRRKEGKTVYYALDDSHIEQIFAQTLQHVRHH
ncbi:MAG: ArsR family transcriptional regulator [Paenibacillaceae bacterium]|jgi:DNA-binding transcriptional ArsR family regulator|nr:ArsR family transcriptional regulator [Paenibacillaceae bacterium]